MDFNTLHKRGEQMNREQFNALEGWFEWDEAQVMKQALDHVKDLDGVIVEAGSYKGKSTAWIASNTDSRVFAIDPFQWNGFEFHGDFLKQTAGYDNVVCIKEDAVSHASKFHQRIKLLFIDCDHTYSLTKKIYELYLPKMVDGGIILFHDCSPKDYVLPDGEGNNPIAGDNDGGWVGPTKALRDARMDNKSWVEGARSLHGVKISKPNIMWHPV